MPTKTITALITCFLLVLSSQSLLAQSSDESKNEESSKSQAKKDEKDKGDKAKDNEKAKEATERQHESADKADKKTILYRLGAGGSEKGNLADTLAEGAKKSSVEDAFKDADGIEAQGQSNQDKSNQNKSNQNQSNKRADVAAGRPLVIGSLDKAEIQKVIKSHRNQIKFCYEKRLAEKPMLAGLVKVKFTISATGKVIAAMVKSSELADREVEACLAQAIRTWVFPEPKGGGIVVVNYPFNFSTSDE